MIEPIATKTPKRIFFGLSAGGLGVLAVMAAVGLFLITPRLSQISPWGLPLAAALAGTVMAYLAAGLLLAAVAAVHRPRGTAGRGLKRWATTRWMLPVATGLGRLLGYSRDAVQRSFLEVNNALVEHRQLRLLPANASMLVLLPHCLQHSGCRLRVTADINVCKECGRCSIGDLKELADGKRITVAVATGGQAARELVKRTRPHAIVAVACERDLTHGICDVAGIPVVGVLNERPNGPCRDTVVDVSRIRHSLNQLSGSPSV